MLFTFEALFRCHHDYRSIVYREVYFDDIVYYQSAIDYKNNLTALL